MKAGESALAPLQPALAQAPTGFAWWLCALAFELAPSKEIAILGGGFSPTVQNETPALLDARFGEFRPNQVVSWKPEGAAIVVPWLEERGAIKGKATAYVCEHFACQMPVTEVEALAV